MSSGFLKIEHTGNEFGRIAVNHVSGKTKLPLQYVLQIYENMNSAGRVWDKTSPETLPFIAST